MTSAYPLRTEPFFRDYLWGGRKLATVLGKPIPEDGVWAESWEMIDHPEHQSKVCNGAFSGQTLGQIASQDPDWLFGTAPDRPNTLPLLLKYLDCQRVLSVQVHPDDHYAHQMTPPDLGKTEAWYIVSAEPGAKLYAGLKDNVTRASLATAISQGTVQDCLHVIYPSKGDCVFIPAGTVHALGAGLLVAEIQQASNTTFRLFDWNRLDTDGKPRALHVEQSLEVINFDSGPRSVQEPQSTSQRGRETLVQCDKFVLQRLQGESSVSVAGDGKLHLLTAPHGGIELKWGDNGNEALGIGESILLPACMPVVQVKCTGDAILLDMYLP